MGRTRPTRSKGNAQTRIGGRCCGGSAQNHNGALFTWFLFLWLLVSIVPAASHDMLSTRSWTCLYYDALKSFALKPELERKACAPAVVVPLIVPPMSVFRGDERGTVVPRVATAQQAASRLRAKS